MELSQEQLKIVNAKEDKIVVVAAAGSGKAQPDYTLIPTPDGMKRLDELQIGDYVFNCYGEKETIIGIYPQGQKQIYEVYFSDGRVVECCEDHLWSYDNSHNGLTTKSLKEMYLAGWVKKDNCNHNSYKYRIPNLKNSVNYNEQKIDIDPYIIGCFLGDGCCLESPLTISSSDEWVVREISSILNCSYRKNHENNYSWTFYTEKGNILTKDFFKKYKQELVCYCGEKSIPKSYLYNSTENRIKLLQGLMDTDGNVGDGHHSPSYYTTSFKLANDVIELCRSLGFTTTLFSNSRDNKKSIEYKINIFTENKNTYKIFRLPRKVNKAVEWINKEQRTNHNFITIRDIKPTEKFTSMRCIYVDHHEHLYLTNDFCVTHNTQCLTERVRKWLKDGVDPSQIVAITFTNMAAQEMRERLGNDYNPQMFIGTIHALANKFLLSFGIDTTSLIEQEKFDKLFNWIQQEPRCVQHKSYCAIDEYQDIDKAQHTFLIEYLNPEHLFIIGDPNQNIYSWRGSNSKYIKGMINDRENYTTYYLNENYRSGKNILEFAKKILIADGIEDYSITTKPSPGKAIKIPYEANFITDTIKEYDSYKDWAILTRNNDQIYKLSLDLKRAGIPFVTFKQSELTKSELEILMQENAVKIITVHSAKGLGWNNIVVYGCNMSRKGDETFVNYVAATRAKERLYWCYNQGKKKPKRQTYSWE